jgi:hypothetical protein
MMSRLSLIIVIVWLGAMATSAQTPAELRGRYGEPQMREVANHLAVIERYLVRPNILITIRYTKQGLPCEAVLEPVPASTPKEGRGEHALEGDYMVTAEVIKLINDLVPIGKRGKKINEMSVNGGDREMKLHHPGCSGLYLAYYEKVSISCSTWCRGGTFSATIHWGKTICRGQTIAFRKR